MRAITIPKHGAPSVLEVRESPDPTPKAGEVRVRVHAAGLNFAEVMARKGLYPDAPKPPMVVGYEVAGVIDAVGSGVQRRRVGERVAALVRFGGHADVVCAPEDQCFAIPDSMPFEEGAALPVNYLTAYHMLFQVFRVKPGDKVLVHMAAGGVGTAVLQLCKHIENVTTIGTASASKHDYVRGHGATHVIDYRTKDYVKEVRALTKDRGVDLVLDALGGPDWKKNYDLLRPSGMLIAFGWANMSTGSTRNLFKVVGQLTTIPKWSPLKLMDENKAVAGVNLGHLWGELDMLRVQGEALVQMYAEGKIKPHVDEVFSFADAAKAHEKLESGKSVGKIVLVP
jgi:NADPH:quinone reductase-like Zn-dependent oxidoreductase